MTGSDNDSENDLVLPNNENHVWEVQNKGNNSSDENDVPLVVMAKKLQNSNILYIAILKWSERENGLRRSTKVAKQSQRRSSFWIM